MSKLFSILSLLVVVNCNGMDAYVTYDDYSNECYKQKCIVQGYALALENLAAFEADPECTEKPINQDRLRAKKDFIIDEYAREVNNLAKAYYVLDEMRKGGNPITRSNLETMKGKACTHNTNVIKRALAERFAKAVEAYRSPDARIPNVRFQYFPHLMDFEKGI